MNTDSQQIVTTDGSLLGDIRAILFQARQKAYSAVNFAMVDSYWHIGRLIVEEEQQGRQRAEYGAGMLRELSRSLSGEFGSGFSYANLKNFRQFFLTYPDYGKGYALRSLLSWSHYRLIMRVENPLVHDFYMKGFAFIGRQAVGCGDDRNRIIRERCGSPTHRILRAIHPVPAQHGGRRA